MYNNENNQFFIDMGQISIIYDTYHILLGKYRLLTGLQQAIVAILHS